MFSKTTATGGSVTKLSTGVYTKYPSTTAPVREIPVHHGLLHQSSVKGVGRGPLWR